MVRARILVPAPVFDEGKLSAVLKEFGAKSLHLNAIWSFLLCHPDKNPVDVPDLPRTLLAPLSSGFKTLTSVVTSAKTSADGSTTKLLVQLQKREGILQDGLHVEAVIMRHNPSAGKYKGGPRGGSERATLCISSQVGCQMGCTFCATGTMGLVGQLAAGEIVEQLVHARKLTPIRNIVFMGMGEPLNNYEALRTAVTTFIGPVFRMSPNHITISTVGVVPRMRTLHADLPGVNLALSLHAPSHSLRTKIVPAGKAYPLHKLMEALDTYLQASGRSVLIEYVMLRDVNDSLQVAEELGQLLQDKKVVVNLIPYNPTSVDALYQPTPPLGLLQFQKVLRERFGLHATVRQEMGGDIGGACGQLVLGKVTDIDIEDLGGGVVT